MHVIGFRFGPFFAKVRCGPLARSGGKIGLPLNSQLYQSIPLVETTIHTSPVDGQCGSILLYLWLTKVMFGVTMGYQHFDTKPWTAHLLFITHQISSNQEGPVLSS